MTRTSETEKNHWTWWRIALVAFLCYSVISFFDILWFASISVVKGFPISWGSTIAANSVYWLLGTFLTLPIVWVTRRAPFEKGRRLRAVGYHVLMIVPVALVHILAHQAILWAMYPGPFPVDKFASMIPKFVAGRLDMEILFYLGIVGAVYVTSYYSRYRERARAAAALELERTQLKASLTEAKLEALKMQLQPHFLFNALHAISTLILKGETRTADQMVSQLSQFLRMTLDSGDAPVVPLAVELEFLDAYLRIQKVRFQDRLQVKTEIEEDALRARVPNLILQPLVENCIEHGLANDPGVGRITIRARTTPSSLELAIEDNGAGLKDDGSVRQGVGLRNIRERLNQLYPGRHSFVLDQAPGGGCRATLHLPLEQEESTRGTHPDAAGG